MPLIRIDWYLAVRAMWQLGPNGLKRIELYFVISEKLMMLLKVKIKFL